MVNYYPTPINLSQIIRRYPELEMVDEDEQQRFEDVAYKRKRGKGAPKKAKTKGVLPHQFLGQENYTLTSQFLFSSGQSKIGQEAVKKAGNYAPNAVFFHPHHILDLFDTSKWYQYTYAAQPLPDVPGQLSSILRTLSLNVIYSIHPLPKIRVLHIV